MYSWKVIVANVSPPLRGRSRVTDKSSMSEMLVDGNAIYDMARCRYSDICDTGVVNMLQYLGHRALFAPHAPDRIKTPTAVWAR